MKITATLLCTAYLLSGCAGAVLGGATTVGVASMQERSLGDNLDDQTIKLEINHYFMQNKVGDVFKDVNVEVQEGRVLLTGRTNRSDVAIEAVRLAWLAAGVREVINEIEVGEKGTDFLNYAQDNINETQIEARLLATKGIRSVNYNIEVVDGVAYILGVAQNEEERHNVAYIASITKGIRRVVSYVRLRNDPIRLEKTGKLREKGVNRGSGGLVDEPTS
jgi:osmotically-inducible protein OsmY